MDNTKKVITIIPAETSIELSQEVYYYMLMQAPFGKLTHWRDIEAFLARKFSVQHISRFDSLPMNMRHPGNVDQNYIIKIIDTVPRHREISLGGYLEHGDSQEKELRAEGHVIVTKGPYKKKAVKDFKKSLVDFDKETNISVETLKKIKKEDRVTPVFFLCLKQPSAVK